ncbi:acyltransferase [Pseudarthrobacter polychromogenes]
MRSRSRQRFKSLDGLRGVAALIVVVYHIALTSPGVAAIYLHPTSAAPSNALEQLLFYSPLHLLWAGREAVLVFFVLSGFVLALPAFRGREANWSAYYPRRVVRLYLPAIASLIFAFFTVLLIPRVEDPAASEWVNDHASPNGLMQVLLGSSLMGGAGALNTPLWSLRWEVLFSLLLPLYLMTARKHQHLLWAKALFLVLAICVGSQTGVLAGALTYLPVFGLGVLMAARAEDLKVLSERLSALVWAAICILTLTLLTVQWNLGAIVEDVTPYRAISTGLTSIGACLAVFICAYFRPAVRAFESTVIRLLGLISFSLYLVHEPIVIGAVTLLGGNPPLWFTYVTVVPVSIAVAVAFYWLIENPSHVLCQKIGRKKEAVRS